MPSASQASRPRRSIRLALCAAGMSVGLTGCAHDPAFWNVVAAGLDYAAYSALLEQTSCRRYPSGCGHTHDRRGHKPDHRTRRPDSDRPHRAPPRVIP